VADQRCVGTIQIDDNLSLFCAGNHTCDLLLALGGNEFTYSKIANTTAARLLKWNLSEEKQTTFASPPGRPESGNPGKIIPAKLIGQKYGFFVKLLLRVPTSLAHKRVVM
jgi:hypothetical protein